MFNSAQVNEWLQENVKAPIFHHYLLLTTKSDLLAYPRPNDIKQYRNEAALVVKAWKDADRVFLEQHNRSVSSHKTGEIQIKDHEMYALTIETDQGNVLVRAIQPCLLLALVGCKPKSSQPFLEKFSAEAKGDERYPLRSTSPPPVIDFSTNGLDEEEGLSPTTPVSTRASSTYKAKMSSSNSSERQAKLSPMEDDTDGLDEALADKQSEILEADLIYLQRDKLDEMADWLTAKLEEKDFRMKEDSS